MELFYNRFAKAPSAFKLTRASIWSNSINTQDTRGKISNTREVQLRSVQTVQPSYIYQYRTPLINFGVYGKIRTRNACSTNRMTEIYLRNITINIQLNVKRKPSYKVTAWYHFLHENDFKTTAKLQSRFKMWDSNPGPLTQRHGLRHYTPTPVFNDVYTFSQ